MNGQESFSIIGNRKQKSAVEKAAQGIFTLCAFIAILAVASITAYMIMNGTPALFKVGVKEILFGTLWKPTAVGPSFGILYVILTSIIGISIFIMMFSLISLINTLVTNIMTRKQELSVLQSIGMTRQQLNKMVQCEAGLIAVWNIAITLLVGGFLGFLLIFSLNGIGMNYLHWAYPMWFAFAYVIIILAVPRLITKVAINLLRQKPLVERLRETG